MLRAELSACDFDWPNPNFGLMRCPKWNMLENQAARGKMNGSPLDDPNVVKNPAAMTLRKLGVSKGGREPQSSHPLNGKPS